MPTRFDDKAHYVRCFLCDHKSLAAYGRISFFEVIFMLKYKSLIMDENAVMRAVKRISYEIIERNRGCDSLCLVGICRRGVPIAEMIAANIEKIEGEKIDCGKLDITFYRDDLSKMTSDPVVNTTDIEFDITDKNVVLVDDVLYTGRTARAAIDALIAKGRPATVQLAVLIRPRSPRISYQSRLCRQKYADLKKRAHMRKAAAVRGQNIGRAFRLNRALPV